MHQLFDSSRRMACAAAAGLLLTVCLVGVPERSERKSVARNPSDKLKAFSDSDRDTIVVDAGASTSVELPSVKGVTYSLEVAATTTN